MSENTEPKDLSVLFANPAKVASELPQAKGPAEENAQPQPNTNQQQQPNAEVKPESNAPTDQKPETDADKLAKTEKRLKDTQTAFQKERKENLEAKKRLQEVGGLSADEENELARLEQDVTDPTQQAMAGFWASYEPVKQFLIARGENPDQAIEAFKLVANGNVPLMEEFMSLRPEERVDWVIKKGTENLELYTELKTHGTLDKALAAIRTKAAAEAATAQSNGSPRANAEQKPTPRVSGNNAPSTQQYARKDLSSLMTK